MKGFIYVAMCTVNRKMYVGQTIRDLRQRIVAHFTCTSGVFPKALRKHGLASFEFIIIDDARTKNELNRKEVFWINHFNCMTPHGYNMTSGGDGFSDFRRTEEHRQKISKSLTGKKASDETRKKIGDASRGRIHSEEAKERIRKGNKGKVVSVESRQKISETRIKMGIGRGVPLSEEHLNNIKVGKQKKLTGVQGVDINMEYYITEAEKLVRPLRG